MSRYVLFFAIAFFSSQQFLHADEIVSGFLVSHPEKCEFVWSGDKVPCENKTIEISGVKRIFNVLSFLSFKAKSPVVCTISQVSGSPTNAAAKISTFNLESVYVYLEGLEKFPRSPIGTMICHIKN